MLLLRLHTYKVMPTLLAMLKWSCISQLSLPLSLSLTSSQSTLKNCPQMQTQFACIMRSKGKSELQKFVYYSIYLFFLFSSFFLQSKLIKNEYATSWASSAFINYEGWTKIAAFLADFLCFPCRVLCVLTTLITLPSIAGTRTRHAGNPCIRRSLGPSMS